MLISSHWIRNLGPTPRVISLRLDLCDLPVQWVTFEKAWNPQAHRTTRPIPPGSTFNMDWIITLPETQRQRRELCQGALLVQDPDSGALLTRLPITLINSKASRP